MMFLAVVIMVTGVIVTLDAIKWTRELRRAIDDLSRDERY